MKNLLFFSLLLATILLFNSCKQAINLDTPIITQDANPYFPSTTGNYWIYDVTTDSLSFIDSVVVTGTRLLDGYNAYEYTTYRNGQLHNISYYVTDNHQIYIYAKVLEPVIDTISGNEACYCLEETWKPLVKFGTGWTFDETKDGDTYPSLVSDTSNPGQYKTYYTHTIHQFQYTGYAGSFENLGIEDMSSKGNSKTINTYKYNLEGHWYYSIDTSGNNVKNVQFKIQPGIRYLSPITIIVQDFNLTAWFSSGIGLVQTESTINNVYYETRKLIKYHVQ